MTYRALKLADRVRVKKVRVSPQHPAVEIKVIGNRDPRGADNNVYIWLDTDDDTLHIRVGKALRCYRYANTVETEAYVEIVQD